VVAALSTAATPVTSSPTALLAQRCQDNPMTTTAGSMKAIDIPAVVVRSPLRPALLRRGKHDQRSEGLRATALSNEVAVFEAAGPFSADEANASKARSDPGPVAGRRKRR
jgi:hypothetical protein